MSRIITAIEIEHKKKEGVYVITKHHKEGAWEGATSGEKVYEVGDYLVHTAWGSGKPIAVYVSEAQMQNVIGTTYKIAPTIK